MATAQPVYAQSDKSSDALSQLSAREGAAVSSLNYAGEISPRNAYEFLREHGGALIDVRTTPEWQFTGVADVSQTRGILLTVSWKTYPSFMQNPQFISILEQQPGITKDTPLFFVCRSGGRSLDAAIAMTQAGFSHCFNVTGGFEGEPDASGHRGTREGWKASQLPWKQG